MVIYERENDWVMVSQHHHGLLSGEISRFWNTSYIQGSDRWNDVIFAIEQHDRGWINLDETPFWNDKTKRPYSFIDFPLVPRLTFYKKGIDEVESNSPYAALLCSMHYHTFTAFSKEPIAMEFSRREKARQRRLKKQLNLIEKHAEELLKTHFLMIQFCDNPSLYLCMQEPGTPKSKEFPWFKDGFPEIFPFTGGKKIVAEWIDSKQVSLTPSPLTSPAEVSVKVKEVKKSHIQQYGIAKAYRDAEWGARTFELI